MIYWACAASLFISSNTTISPIDGFEKLLEEYNFRGAISLRSTDGEAKLEFKRKYDPQHPVYWVGSASKQFAGVAALKLAEESKLDLDKPINQHQGRLPWALLPDFTTRELAAHLSGMGHAPECRSFELNEPQEQESYIECLADATYDPKHPRGTYRYSNDGFSLIGLLIEDTLDIPYNEALSKLFFEPVGMQQTGSIWKPELAVARGYARLGPIDLPTWPWLGIDPSFPAKIGASGNLYSSVEDLHRWNIALHQGQILKPKSYEALITPVQEDYGMGIAVSEKLGKTIYWHNGSIDPVGWSSFIAYLPDLKWSLVAVSNRPMSSSGLMRLTDTLIRRQLSDEDKPFPEKPSPAWLPLIFLMSWAAVPVLAFRSTRIKAKKSWLGWAAGTYINLFVILFFLSVFSPKIVPIFVTTILSASALVGLWRAKNQIRQVYTKRDLLTVIINTAVVIFLFPSFAPIAAKAWFLSIAVMSFALIAIYFAVSHQRDNATGKPSI